MAGQPALAGSGASEGGWGARPWRLLQVARPACLPRWLFWAAWCSVAGPFRETQTWAVEAPDRSRLQTRQAGGSTDPGSLGEATVFLSLF